MTKKGNVRKAIGVVLALLLWMINLSPRVQSLRNLPGMLVLDEGQSQAMDFLFPIRAEVDGESVGVAQGKDQTLADKGVSPSADATIIAKKPGASTVNWTLMGISLGKTEVEVTPQRTLIPGGQAIGVAMMTEGVYVVDTSNVMSYEGQAVNPASAAGIFPGDTILAVDGVEVRNLDELAHAVMRNTGAPMLLKIKNDNGQKTLAVTPVVDREGIPRLGIWGRDSTAGVGTLTYVDPAANAFGALGHAITDADTRKILPVRDGGLYPSSIVGVSPGRQGKPGELQGMFSTDDELLGVIQINTEYGVYGEYQGANAGSLYPEGLPVALRSAVYEGAAQILSSIDGNGVQAYDCRIVKIANQNAPETRSMVIEITDPALLKKTGGIVQGMSGSPIIQGGCIIGAVTHVYVNDPTRGYGLFIEWMLETQQGGQERMAA